MRSRKSRGRRATRSGGIVARLSVTDRVAEMVEVIARDVRNIVLNVVAEAFRFHIDPDRKD